MIDWQGGRILVQCDSCLEVLDTDTDNSIEAREAMRREGWKVRKLARDSEWLHGCPICGVPT